MSSPGSPFAETFQRTAGDAARTMNLTAGQAVATAIRTTLGPFGLDKLLVDTDGTVVVTNDGHTILEAMTVTNPAARLVIEVARTQTAAVGDGTTAAVVLTGELLACARTLIERGVHPSAIIEGYQYARSVAEDHLRTLSRPLDTADTDTLEQIARTVLTGTTADPVRAHLATLVVAAVRAGSRETGAVDRDAIRVVSYPGGTLTESRFVRGTMIDQTPPHDGMAQSVRHGTVLVYEGAIEQDTIHADASTTVTGFDEYTALLERERIDRHETIGRIVDSGATVVLAAGGIDDSAQGLLADAGILALRRVSDEDRRQVALATGATPVGDLAELSPAALGAAGRVELERIRQFGHPRNARPEQSLVFEDCPGGDTGTIVLRGGTERRLAEIERTLDDCITTVIAAFEDGLVLPGGGATEMALSLELQHAATSLAGRDGLAVTAYADALQKIPQTLAETAGDDPIDTLVELRAAHHDGHHTTGLVDSSITANVFESGVIEPLGVKRSALRSATAAATMLLRIDAVVADERHHSET